MVVMYVSSFLSECGASSGASSLPHLRSISKCFGVLIRVVEMSGSSILSALPLIRMASITLFGGNCSSRTNLGKGIMRHGNLCQCSTRIKEKRVRVGVNKSFFGMRHAFDSPDTVETILMIMFTFQ